MDKAKEFQETVGLETRAALAEAGRIQNEISQALQASLTSVAQAGTIASELKSYAIKGLEKAEAMARQSQQFLESNISQVPILYNSESSICIICRNILI
jgi:hypothetical protein